MNKTLNDLEKSAGRLLRLPPKTSFSNYAKLGHAGVHEAWRVRPQRGVILDEAFRRARIWTQFSLSHPAMTPFLRVRGLLLLRELSSARTLTYIAHTMPVPGQSVWMDGYLRLPSGRGLTLDVICLGSIRSDAMLAWDMGNVATDIGLGKELGPLTVLLPQDTLSPEKVEEGIRRWYKTRFEWKHSHWTNRENKQPDFTFDISWGSPDDFPGLPFTERMA